MTSTSPSLLLDAKHTALPTTRCQAHRPPDLPLDATLIALPTTRWQCKAHRLTSRNTVWHHVSFYCCTVYDPHFNVAFVHVFNGNVSKLMFYWCSAVLFRWCRHRCCSCCRVATAADVVVLLPPPLLLLLLLFYWCHCCGRGMCCPSTQHVWVEAECMYEWMPSICMSRCRVHVWVDGECMCEWMLSVCVSGWWMHVWVVSGCWVYVRVHGECMCEWMLNACVSGETILMH